MTASNTANLVVYVINLDRSVDRLNVISAQLSAQQLAFVRIPAVDGKQASPEQLALLDESRYRRSHGKTSVPGELGCYLSHVEAIRQFAGSGHDFAIVLEDDALVQPNFFEVVHSLTRCAQRWDVVKLSGVHSGTPARVFAIDASHDLCVMFSRCTGASAYVLNQRAAQNYLKRLLPMFLPFDHEFDKGWKYALRVRAVRPFPVLHNEHVATTIATPLSKHRRLPAIKRLSTHLYRLANELTRLNYATRQYLKERW